MGRQVREKDGQPQGKVPEELAPILERLGFQAEYFVEAVNTLPLQCSRAIGRPETVAERAKSAGKRWFRGISMLRQAFLPSDDSDAT